MKIVKKYVFCSPKSSGNTLIALNMALLHQQWKPAKHIAYLQLSHFPDVHTYSGIMHTKTILDLKYLIDAQEADVFPLSPIFQSPMLNEWSELSAHDVNNILTFLEGNYDTIYIDLHVSVGEKIVQEMLNQSTKIVIPTNIDPSSLAGVESFFSKYKSFSPRCFFLFNQCPPRTASLMKQKLKKHDIHILGTLPILRKYLWAQVFETVPLVFHRKSKWKKTLFHLLQKLTT